MSSRKWPQCRGPLWAALLWPWILAELAYACLGISFLTAKASLCGEWLRCQETMFSRFVHTFGHPSPRGGFAEVGILGWKWLWGCSSISCLALLATAPDPILHVCRRGQIRVLPPGLSQHKDGCGMRT